MTIPYEEILLLEIGDKAPDFSLSCFPSGIVSLSDLVGKNVVLAFYPKDDTSNSTREMCAFSEHLEHFRGANTVVYGISCDTIDSHSEFSSKYQIKVPLLADPDGEIGRKYGAVRVGRHMPDRIAYIIDKLGRIAYVSSGVPDIGELLKAVPK